MSKEQQKPLALRDRPKEKEEENREDQSAIVHPPDMPIVIDEGAVEDILGVRINVYYHGYSSGMRKESRKLYC